MHENGCTRPRPHVHAVSTRSIKATEHFDQSARVSHPPLSIATSGIACARTHAQHLLHASFAAAHRQPAIPGGKEQMKRKAVYLRHRFHISPSLLQT
ncbi:hypothetical protein FQA47_024528 [Oryzias melastigma]|uniref:Uncharacterized protein n=1 Tax=Oryzias melastigma TaxID=30732 RepID=A0A834FJX2_ORYME|nr:hypothetical protein FQA47_024528 [Oryzias melastigma]